MSFRGVPPGIGSPPSVLVRSCIDTRKPILIYFFYDTPPAPGDRIGTLRRTDTAGVILVRWDHIGTAGTVLVRGTILVRCDHIGTPGTILIHGGPILVHRTILVPLDHIGTRAPPTPAPTCSEVNVWTYRGVTLGEIDASESFWNASDSHSCRSG